MKYTEIKIPQMGEGVTEATITRWLVREGDRVDEDKVIVELATDKVDNELPSPVKGVIAKILFTEGQVVSVGKVIAIVTEDGKIPDMTERKSPDDIKTFAANPEAAKKTISDDITGSHIALSPLVRNMVRENNLSSADLKAIKGSGLEGRITKDDILNYLDSSIVVNVPDEVKPVAFVKSEPVISEEPGKHLKTDYSVFGDVQITEMSRMRKLIAGHMVDSIRTAPHVTSFIKADVTNLFNWQKKHKDDFEKKEGERLTLMPLFVREVVLALKECPEINVSLSGDKIIYKKYINIGIATALPDGNLIVPVIKKADEKNLFGLARSVNDLSGRARANKLLPDEITGGSFTITNLGSFGTLTGTPVINQPESAILALGAVRKEPAVIETPDGDAIAIRYMIILSITYDHRIIDGALAGKFLNILTKNIEKFDINSLI